MKSSVSFIGDKATHIANTIVIFFLLTFKMEGNANFQLEVSENKGAFFSQSNSTSSIHTPPTPSLP